MWFRRRIILIPLGIAVLLAGSIAGIAFAQDSTGSSGNPLFARVATILGIDQTELEDAFAQAQKEMRDEALTDYLGKLVEEGKITQAEADQYRGWWDSKPDALDKLAPGFGFGGRGGGFGPGCGMRIAPFQSTQSSVNTQ
jgi:hypothetical protein